VIPTTPNPREHLQLNKFCDPKSIEIMKNSNCEFTHFKLKILAEFLLITQAIKHRNTVIKNPTRANETQFEVMKQCLIYSFEELQKRYLVSTH